MAKIKGPKSAYKATSKIILQFGMVAIPAKLYKATEDNDLKFNQLHKECGHRLRQQPMFCPHCSEHEISEPLKDLSELVVTVERDAIIKGYEYETDKFVVLTDEEIASVVPAKDVKVAIDQFVPALSLDPLYVSNEVSFIGADIGGEKACVLLAKTLAASCKVGIARLTQRGKVKTVAVRPYRVGENTYSLILQTIRYQDEIRDAKGVEGYDLPVQDDELALATAIVDKMSAPEFDPSRYTNTVREKLEKLIESKKNNEEYVVADEPETQASTDLLAALRASLGEAA